MQATALDTGVIVAMNGRMSKRNLMRRSGQIQFGLRRGRQLRMIEPRQLIFNQQQPKMHMR